MANTNINITTEIDNLSVTKVTGNKSEFNDSLTDGNFLFEGDINGITDGDKGDITVSNSGETFIIDNNAVTNDKINDVNASKVNEDSTHRFVTDTEKSNWNNKLNRDGSNANTDVDLGSYSLNAKSFHVKGTNGAGHIGLKHQNGNITAIANESSIGANSSGNPVWKNDGNAIQNIMLENGAIVGATKTKLTYDSKGRVTAGTDAAISDITGLQSALNNKENSLGFTPENSAHKGISNGYASLDGTGKVPASELPSYVDDVLDVANYAALPVTGETGKIYITIDNNNVYRWSGTIYVQISTPNALWGSITGTLSNQTDLQNALNAKQATLISGTNIKTLEGQSLLGSGNIDLTKSDVGLSNVDNTSDLNKPISNATQTALDNKESIITSGTTAQYYRGDKTFQTLDKSAVGLSNVDNTSDLNKPISTATQTALNAKQDSIILTTTGTSGAATLVGSTLNIPNYATSSGTVTSVGLSTGTTGTDINVSGSPVTGSGSLNLNIPTANATNTGKLSNTDWSTFNNKQNALVSGTNIKTVNSTSLLGSGNVSVGTVTNVSALTLGTTGTDLSSSVATGTTTPVITLNVPTASAINRGVLSPTDWNIFNAKQTLLVSGINIKTVNSTSILGSGDLAVGTVTNVSALTIGTTGTDIASTVATGTTTPVITLNIPTASATNRGALSSTDWSTFNNKQGAITLTTTGTSGASTLVDNTLNIPNYSSSIFSKKAVYDYFNDFINTVGSTTSGGSELAVTNSGTAAASSNQTPDAANRIGVVRCTTGTTATGRTAISTGASAFRLGGGAWTYETAINITTLSNSTDRFQFAIGFIDIYTAANQVDGVYFLYDEGAVSTGSTAATYWQTVTCSNSVRTFNTGITQTTVTAATWVKLRIEINAAASSVGFYVNDVLISTHTTNIPTAAGRDTGFGSLLIKSIGLNARTVDCDYMLAQCQLTTPR